CVKLCRRRGTAPRGPRINRGRFRRALFKGYAANQPITPRRSCVIDPVDADVDYDGTVPHMFCPNKPGLTDRRDDDVSRARNGREVARARVHYRYGRIVSLLHKEKRERLAHDHAATEHDDMCPADRDAAFPEQPQTTQRCARNEACDVTERELRDLDEQ